MKIRVTAVPKMRTLKKRMEPLTGGSDFKWQYGMFEQS